MQTEFLRTPDLEIVESEDHYILRKGFIHVNELVIDKAGSTADFVAAFRRFAADGRIQLNDEGDRDVHADFTQLCEFDLVARSNVAARMVLFAHEGYRSRAEALIGDVADVQGLDSFVDERRRKLVVEDKNPLELNAVKSDVSARLDDSITPYFLAPFREVVSLRAINRLFKLIDREFILGAVDYCNVYLTSVRHGYTGCFECLEKHIASKFDSVGGEPGAEALYPAGADLVLSFIRQDIENRRKFNSSTLTGNVIHMYTPAFEYHFDLNRRTALCPTCATLNQARFVEQNMNSANIIKALATRA